MPSQKPRLNLTLDDELKQVVADLSELTGKSQAGIITDFLKEAYPALVTLRDAYKDIKDQKNALPHLAKMSALASQKTSIINSEMSDLINQIDWVGNK